MMRLLKIVTAIGVVVATTSAAFAAPLESGQPRIGETKALASSQRQRAPGVPLAPTVGEQRGQHAKHEASVQADRSIPMPRPVPSIIAR